MYALYRSAVAGKVGGRARPSRWRGRRRRRNRRRRRGRSGGPEEGAKEALDSEDSEVPCDTFTSGRRVHT